MTRYETNPVDIAEALRCHPAELADHLRQSTMDSLQKCWGFSWAVLSRGDRYAVRNAACEAALALKLEAYGARSANRAWGLLAMAWTLDQLAAFVVNAEHTPGDRAEWVAEEMAMS